MSLTIFACLMLLSTAAGYAAARLVPWRSDWHLRCLALPLAILLAPFLLGLSVMIALVIFPGAEPQNHVKAAAAGLLVLAFGLIFVKRSLLPAVKMAPAPRGVWFWLLVVLLAACVTDLLYLVWRLPLTENDALEYGLVGRAIYEARSLAVYPLLDQSASSSGFFAPWTHPPLYPSLIYAAYALQESAAVSGWMKLVAPWFLLAAVVAVIGMGRLQSLRAGLMAGVLLVSMPLLATGAETAAIDSLPVAGMALLMIGLVGLDRAHRFAGIYMGVFVGLALWTHSQAILYLPILMAALVLTGGMLNWRSSLRLAFFSLLVALLLAGYPYWRNFAIYGTPISDNPLVFSLPSLDWDGFFKYTRSIYDWSSRLQYGVFKGLVAVHNYGFIFWMGAVALLYLLFAGRLRRWWGDAGRLHSLNGADGSILVSLAILVIYYAGVLSSIFLSMDLMIKNDRYLLVVAPPMALLAACGVARLLGDGKEGYALQSRTVKWGPVAVMTTLFLGHAAAFLLYGNLAQWLQLLEITRPDPLKPLEVSFRENPLDNWHSIQIAQSLHEYSSPEKRVLVLRPADMFYSKQRMLSYLDPSMVPIYGQKESHELRAQLLAMGVNLVHVQNYLIPPLTNSGLMGLLADPDLTTLVKDSQFNQLYALKLPSKDTPHARGEPLDLKAWSWVEYPRIGVGGPAFSLGSRFYRVAQLPDYAFSENRLLAKSYSHMLEVGQVGRYAAIAGTKAVPIEVYPEKEYLLDFDTEGEGFFRIWVWLRGKDSDEWSGPSLAGDFVLSPRVEELRFKRRMKIPKDMHRIRIGIERYGISRLELKDARLQQLAD